MKKLIVAAAIAFTSTSALADTTMKPGLWEVRTIKQVMDGRDMTAQIAAAQQQMQQMLASMTPAQRKQMEQSMGVQAMPDNTQRICISPAMAANDTPVMDADTHCKPTKQRRSGNSITFELNCPTITGKGETIINGNTVINKMDMVTTEGGQSHTMQSESQMTYLGADCKGIKPADQVAREIQGMQSR